MRFGKKARVTRFGKSSLEATENPFEPELDPFVWFVLGMVTLSPDIWDDGDP